MRISSIINLSDTISMAILCSCYMLDFLFYHVIGKGSIVWKQGVVLLIFLFEDGRDGRTGNTSKQQKMVVFSEEFLSENQFEGVLAISVVLTMVSTFLRQLRGFIHQTDS